MNKEQGLTPQWYCYSTEVLGSITKQGKGTDYVIKKR